uniref:Uncharacterized protein n=1 Tax=Tanacetum cinerariifolium TaxID=118510 RepID=A0A6L2KYT7_TANCI|nr:hypothetical protein [Tanacetum cinerariifolium]
MGTGTGVMRLVQGVLQSLVAGKSLRCVRSLATSSASGVDERPAMNSRFSGSRRYGLVDGLDDNFTSLTHGLDGKLKDVATYFEYGVNEVEKEDYKLRPDVTFWPGNTYDVKE